MGELDVGISGAAAFRQYAKGTPPGHWLAQASPFDADVLRAEHEACPDGILVVDAQGRIISFNRKFTEMWDVPEDLIAARLDQPVLDLVAAHVADEPAFLARVSFLYEHPDEKSVDEILLKDGRALTASPRR